jgi:putative MATE family efflux protein
VKDLTTGRVGAHIVSLSTFIALSTLFQTLYFLADLYFVGRLGKEAIAGVALAGNLMMLVLALTQSLGVGTTSLIAQAIGRKDRRQAEVVFNQALVLSHLVGLGFGVVTFLLRGPYARWLAADAATAELGARYLDWFVPALFLQFVLVAMGAALRGLGDMKVPTLIQIGTVLLNIALAPALMFGWGLGIRMGVTGAAVATFVAVAAGCVAFTAYFRRASSPLRFRPAEWRPQPRLWADMLRIGLPAGGEFLLMTLYLVLVYALVRPFGAAAQAGFGVAGRVMQALFLPAVAIAFATAPVVGQNFGARLGRRVRDAFTAAAGMVAAVMVAITVICQIAPESLMRFFNSDPGVVAVGAEYLRIVSWNFLASGVIFVTGSVFQGLGNTLPPLASSALRLALFTAVAYVLSHRTDFALRQLWYLSLATVIVHLVVVLWLLRRELSRRLPVEPAAEVVTEPAAY